MTHERLTDDLRELGRDLEPTPDVDALSERVMRRVEQHDTAGAPDPANPRRRAKPVAVAVIAVLVALALTPPVRAAVSEWFGVVVNSGPAAEPEPVPTAEGGLTVGEASELAGFEPLVPEPLGTPEAVSVSSDSLVVSMSWSRDGETIRLDQFEGMLEPRFVKQTPGVEFVALSDGVSAVWFPEPHRVLQLTDGRETPELGRTAAPTLIWPVGELTMRLEGLNKDDAIDVAESTIASAP